MKLWLLQRNRTWIIKQAEFSAKDKLFLIFNPPIYDKNLAEFAKENDKGIHVQNHDYQIKIYKWKTHWLYK